MKNIEKFYKYYNSIISIIGFSNVGKSFLFNKILNKKISIVNKKIQYTRKIIVYDFILNEKKILLIDNPGFIFKKKKYIYKIINQYIYESINISNIILYVTINNKYYLNKDKFFFYFKKKIKKNIILIIFNKKKKIDNFYLKLFIKKNIININNINSFFKKKNNLLINRINKLTKKKKILFNYKYNITYGLKFNICEIIRNNVYKIYKKEIPYSSEIIIEKFLNLKNKLIIYCIIYLEKISQKKILIGKNGKNINKLSLYSRKYIKKIYKKKIYIDFIIKIIKWKNNYKYLKFFGYF
ncbi:MAG: GTPase Era [Candidatus Shikimatogenerans bostrichidophilus]|nr:MAG: GTPase Era [Candidatus Shikimatogenerans bostrichidophilus]